MSKKLERKVAVVTGGNSGIGRALATPSARQKPIQAVAGRTIARVSRFTAYISYTPQILL
jgi:NAD(P)-dependent dehydrogenase (short-subunit alcohol dehydrogenase family)